MNRRVVADYVWPLGVFGALAFVPRLDWHIPKIFDSAISSPGTLQLLALCLLFGGLMNQLIRDVDVRSFGHVVLLVNCCTGWVRTPWQRRDGTVAA